MIHTRHRTKIQEGMFLEVSKVIEPEPLPWRARWVKDAVLWLAGFKLALVVSEGLTKLVRAVGAQHS